MSELPRAARITLECLDPKYKFVARDKDLRLFAFENYPRKESTGWVDDKAPAFLLNDPNQFTMINWEDEQPKPIVALLYSSLTLLLTKTKENIEESIKRSVEMNAENGKFIKSVLQRDIIMANFYHIFLDETFEFLDEYEIPSPFKEVIKKYAEMWDKIPLEKLCPIKQTN